MTVTALLLILGVVAGSCIGAGFFGALWWTTHRLSTARRPGLLLAASLFGRLGLLALSLVVLVRLDAALLIGALIGLIVVRVAMTHAASHDRLPVPAPALGAANERT
jgi:F1F0 ATPase subunit 2